ncbi:MAG: glycosyltransferase family 4 protein [Methylococcales bacterium]|nr:glycosyltransferase family 4 protein [Methylococcales bacterium]
MNIAIFDHVGKKAGMDYYSSSLAKGLLNKDCKTTIYSNFVGIEPSKINYKTFYEGHSKGNAFLKLYRLLHATAKASFDARKGKADLVILHLFSADAVTLLLVAIPKLFGLKTAVISHDVSSFTDNDNRLVQNLIYNTFSDFIIVHNHFSYKTLMQNIRIKDSNKVTIIKHGGYLDHIGLRPDKKQLRHELGLEEDGKYILFFGQIKKVKGLDILLEAMSELTDDIKLIIAGKPWKDDFSSYDEQIKKHHLQERVIKMIRFIEDNEREKLFFATDVNVLPYRIIYQSGVLLMAMSQGLPVIASDLLANKEIINDKANGLLFHNENADDLAAKITLFFQDRALQKKLSVNALSTIASEYNWDDIALKYLEMMKGK